MNVAYVFSPFILANLNKKTIYSTPFTAMIRDLLSPFYQVHHHTQIHIDRTLESLNLYLDIFEYDDDLDFVFLKLIQAICRSDTSKIFILTYLKIDLEILNQMSHFLKVKIYVIKQQAGDTAFRSNQIDQKKLLFKRKDDLHQKLCHKFSEINGKDICRAPAYFRKNFSLFRIYSNANSKCKYAEAFRKFFDLILFF